MDGKDQVLKGLEKNDRVVVSSDKPLKDASRVGVVDALVKSGDQPSSAWPLSLIHH